MKLALDILGSETKGKQWSQVQFTGSLNYKNLLTISFKFIQKLNSINQSTVYVRLINKKNKKPRLV